MQESELIALIARIAPEQMEQLTRRAQALSAISSMQPVGRRALAAHVNLPEREIRTMAAALREEGLLRLDAAGMQLTEAGQALVPAAEELSRTLCGLTELERSLCQLTGVRSVTVVAGNADADAQVLRTVGRVAAHHLRNMLQNGATLAVTGGRTMRAVAEGMQSAAPMDVMVVPGRGGIGSSVENQASVIAAEIARRLGGRYQVMHIPDTLDEAALQEMLRLPEVQDAIRWMEQADIVLHGIGRADEMAAQRRLPASALTAIEAGGAVGEAFGDFFDAQGRNVYQMSTVSAGMLRHNNHSRLFAVAAGRKKGQAIIAALRHEPHAALVTDEGAARQMLRLLQDAN